MSIIQTVNAGRYYTIIVYKFRELDIPITIADIICTFVFDMVDLIEITVDRDSS